MRREAAGLSREQLAVAAGISTRQVSRYEDTGDQRQSPTLRVAKRIADALGVSVNDLIEVVA
jgi:transcriptional regulator with XRE-family HTH domain